MKTRTRSRSILPPNGSGESCAYVLRANSSSASFIITSRHTSNGSVTVLSADTAANCVSISCITGGNVSSRLSPDSRIGDVQNTSRRTLSGIASTTLLMTVPP